MVVRVRLHTTLRRQTADGIVDRLTLDLAEGATVRTAVDTLGIEFDEDAILPLVNGKVASVDTALTDGDELRLIPAISGGGAGSRNHRLFRAIRRLNFGDVIVNDSAAFRADHISHGGDSQSCQGPEGGALCHGGEDQPADGRHPDGRRLSLLHMLP